MGFSLTLAFASCVVQPAGPGPAGPGYAQPQGPGASMQAGCAFHANELQQRAPGVAYLVTCPPGCAAAGGTVWGSGPYTADSAMCMSAVHSGAISDQGGSFQVVMDQGQPAYRGSVQNNVPSTDYGSYGESYWIRIPDGSPPPAASAAPTAGPPGGPVGLPVRAQRLSGPQTRLPLR